MTIVRAITLASIIFLAGCGTGQQAIHLYEIADTPSSTLELHFGLAPKMSQQELSSGMWPDRRTYMHAVGAELAKRAGMDQQTQEAVAKGEVFQGMEVNAVRYAWGDPWYEDIENSTWGHVNRWTWGPRERPFQVATMVDGKLAFAETYQHNVPR